MTSTAHDIVQLALSSPDQTVRCVGGEALGRLAQVCGGGGQVALVQRSFDLLKTSRDISLRTGHSLGLGCVHRCLGAVGAGQHIGMSVALLLALAKDNTASVCQVRVGGGMGGDVRVGVGGDVRVGVGWGLGCCEGGCVQPALPLRCGPCLHWP